jgi:hypothetical protein
MVLLLALGAMYGTAARWRRATAVELLAATWIVLGCVELVVHDAGNERRFIFLIPPLLALAAIVMGRDRRLLAPETTSYGLRRLLVVSPFLLFGFYVLAGAAMRVAFGPQIRPGVRAGTIVALVLAAALIATWPRPARWMSRGQWSLGAALVLLAVIVTGDLAEYVQWTTGRTYFNYEAMRSVSTWLPPGTLVQGKLANGLALESRIRPVFVGRGFGNYDDRLQRDDIRYVLTYTRPYLGYEGRVILDVLRASPWRVVRRFRVAESSTGDDEAALIEKVQRRGPAAPPGDR